MLTWQSSFPVASRRIGKRLSLVVSFSSSSSHLHQCSLRYAVLGAGLSVAWHLLEHSTTELNVCIDVLDEVGIGGGASGVSGGLLHPYSPKVKPLWRAAECWEESLRLINIAENAIHSKEVNGFIARRRGILRPGVSLKNMSVMIDNAENYLADCRIQSVNENAARSLVPNIRVPSDTTFYMPDAVNIHPQNYLESGTPTSSWKSRVCLENLGLWGALHACRLLLKGDRIDQNEAIKVDEQCDDDVLCGSYLSQVASYFSAECNKDHSVEANGTRAEFSSVEALRFPVFSWKLLRLVRILSSFRSVMNLNKHLPKVETFSSINNLCVLVISGHVRI